MHFIEITDSGKINYETCIYLLRNHIDKADIYCNIQTIVESLMLYMTEINIPNALIDFEGKGYRLKNQRFEAEGKHYPVLISRQKEDADLLENVVDSCFIWLRDITMEQIEELVIEPEQFDIDKYPAHLKNQEIRKMFLRSFIIAKEEIDIISPWMNFKVVSDSLIMHMENALQKGVKIKIIYGLNPGNEEFDQFRSARSDEVCEKLKTRFNKYGDAFGIKRENIHYKLVLCDERFALEGSFNYLSFIGDYSDEDTRQEGSPFIRDKEYIRSLRKDYFGNGCI